MNVSVNDRGTPIHIAFEGPMAAGKTTHANLLGRRLGVRVLLEQFEQNEFLADFYENQTRWSLPMQISFLLSRHAQLVAAVEPLGPCVADYTYRKDRLFARMLLVGRELRLYEDLWARLGEDAQQPSIVIYLDAPDQVLLERIRARGRPYERHIGSDYLARVRSSYEEWFASGSAPPVCRIDTGPINLDDEADVAGVQEAIIEAARVRIARQ